MALGSAATVIALLAGVFIGRASAGTRGSSLHGLKQLRARIGFSRLFRPFEDQDGLDGPGTNEIGPVRESGRADSSRSEAALVQSIGGSRTRGTGSRQARVAAFDLDDLGDNRHARQQGDLD